MSTPEASVKPENLNEIGDSVAAMVACVLQEQLAPILETVREHSRLLDWHSALLNHSTLMNRYNVGKLDDLRDLQTNVNYKLQFHIDPEDRKRPTYRGTPPTSIPQRIAVTTNTLANTKSSYQKSDSPPTPLPVPPPSYTDTVGAPRSETSDSATHQPSPTTQLSERAAGKKRKREDDASEAPIAGTSDSDCDTPERKRKKDTTISTECVPIPESFLRVARLNIFGELSFEERQCEVEQIRYMRNLFRGT